MLRRVRYVKQYPPEACPCMLAAQTRLFHRSSSHAADHVPARVVAMALPRLCGTSTFVRTCVSWPHASVVHVRVLAASAAAEKKQEDELGCVQ